MRLSAFLLLISLTGTVAGAAMIGRWAVGLTIVVYSAAVGVFALLRDSGQPRTEMSGREAVRARARQAA